MQKQHPLKRFYEIIDKGDIEYKLNNIPEFPTILEFEVTNNCNFKCLMCKTGVGSALRNRGFMEKDVYEKIISEAKQYDIAIKFVGQGEPLLHKDFMYFLALAKQNNIVCHLTTNASYLTEEMMKQMIELKLDSIKFSFQGVNKEGYYEMRQKDYFDEMLKKIIKMYELRGESEFPFITINTSITDEPKEEIRQFREMAEKICDEVQIGSTTLEFIDLDKITEKKTFDRLVDLKERQTLKKIRYTCCNQVFDVTTVRWNGDISACCADNDGIMTIGNVKEDTIKNIWSGSKLNTYRNILKDNRYDDLPLCKNCYDFMGYMTKQEGE